MKNRQTKPPAFRNYLLWGIPGKPVWYFYNIFRSAPAKPALVLLLLTWTITSQLFEERHSGHHHSDHSPYYWKTWWDFYFHKQYPNTTSECSSPSVISHFLTQHDDYPLKQQPGPEEGRVLTVNSLNGFWLAVLQCGSHIKPQMDGKTSWKLTSGKQQHTKHS